jgi:hypothetical protein
MRRLVIGLWQQNDKLVAADPGDHVDSSDFRFDRIGCEAQHRIARGVPEPVVDTFTGLSIGQWADQKRAAYSGRAAGSR